MPRREELYLADIVEAVHDYFAVEWALVWAICRHDVPVLYRQLRTILAADYPLVLAVVDGEPEA